MHHWLYFLTINFALLLTQTGQAQMPGSAAKNSQIQLRLLAGNYGGPGSVDRTGAAARFNYPDGVAVDSLGNVYIADANNNTIRKITPTGVVSTLAGSSGISGSVDGIGAAARFKYPTGIVVDNSGNVYVADTSNYTIRKVTPASVVTTLAGATGIGGSADGTGVTARFFHPSGLAVDSSGNVYVADRGNHTVRKITSVGVVTTLAGNAGNSGSADGISTAARFDSPTDLAIDNTGNIYVLDSFNSTIRKITPAGVVTTLAGNAGNYGSADGSGAAARFDEPRGLDIDTVGNIYVTDTNNKTVRKTTPAGVVTTLAGAVGFAGSTDGTGAAARFGDPRGIAVDSSGNLYVVDTDNHTVRKITSAGVVTTLAGNAGSVGSTNGTGAAARFSYPDGIVADSSGNLYVADTYNHTIRKITSAGVVTTLAGSAGISGSADGTGTAARFNSPSGIAADSSGNLYVADTFNYTIRKITSAGVVTTLAGSAGISGSADGTGAAAQFNSPYGVAADSSGNVYVADTFNHTVRKITSAGVVTTLAGSAGISGSTDGTGTAARFNYLTDIAAHSSGNVYVADTSNNTVRKITPAGVVTTLAGSAGISGSADGTGAAARFGYPAGISLDSSGNVYVADSNNTIRKITPAGVVTTPIGNGRKGISLGNLPAQIYEPSSVTVGPNSLILISLGSILQTSSLLP